MGSLPCSLVTWVNNFKQQLKRIEYFRGVPLTREPDMDSADRRPPLLKTRLSSFGISKQGAKSTTKTNETSSKSKTKGLQSFVVSEPVVSQSEKITSKSGYDPEAEATFEKMLQGDLRDLPPLPRSAVRIFLSSTFSDMRAERNTLAQHVYPHLQKACATLGLDFQVVDLRWGLTTENQNDHSDLKICLQEIENCQNISLGPNFVCFVGHRYGMHRPLKTEMLVAEFDILLAEAKTLQLPGVPLMELWYRKDENAVPAVYALQPIRAYYPDFGDITPGKEELRRQALMQWTDTECVLQTTIQDAAKSLYQAKKLSSDAFSQFFMSVTHYEIVKGILECEHPKQHSVFFSRELTGLTDEVLQESAAAKYADIIKKDGKLVQDEKTSSMIANLLINAEKKLGPGYIISLSVPWKKGGLDPDKNPEHKQYILQFCDIFTKKVMNLIDQAKSEKKARIRQQSWYTEHDEVLHHLHFCNQKTELFCGQDTVLQQAKAYILDTAIRKPTVIFAESGAGKTSIMAMIMKNLKSWLPDGYVGIIRFLGTSPRSTNVNDVLFGVCGQLADAADMIMERINYRTWKGMKVYAPRFLRHVAPKFKHPVVILLDSLDQLAPNNDAFSMDWLPRILPANIKLIVSTLPEKHNILSNLKKFIPDLACYLEVPLLPEVTGENIVKQKKNRTITDKQMSVILKLFNSNANALYLKLLMDHAVRWASFQTPETLEMPSCIPQAIDALFDGLEASLGKKLVGTALGLITVGLNGLSDRELEDGLSCSDDTLDDVYRFHDPPVPGIVRIPPVMWARIHYKLREYMVERLSQGKLTKFWYHRAFITAAFERYAKNEKGAHLHAALFEMFSSENGVRKSITLSHRNKLFVKDADRQTTPQSLTVGNIRKLETMMYHLLHMTSTEVCSLAKSAVYANFSFVSTAIAALGIDRVLENLSDFLRRNKDKELVCLRRFLESKKNLLLSSRSLAFNLLTCLTPPSSYKHLQGMLDQAKDYLMSGNHADLIPRLPCLAAWLGDPSFMLHSISQIIDEQSGFLLSEMRSADEDLKCFAVINAASSEVKDVYLQNGITCVKLTNGGQGFAFLSKDCLKLRQISSQKETSMDVKELFRGAALVPRSTEGMKITISTDSTQIAVISQAQAAVSSLDLKSQLLISIGKIDEYDIRSLHFLAANSSAVFVASGEFRGVTSAQSYVALWSAGNKEPHIISRVNGSLNHSLLVLTADEEYLVGSVMTTDGEWALAIIQVQPFNVFNSILVKEIHQICCSPTEQVIAVQEASHYIQFVDITTKQKLEQIHHESSVSKFYVAWEDDSFVLADSADSICVYSRKGHLLKKWPGNYESVAYLTIAGDRIAILTSSGVLQTWDLPSESGPESIKTEEEEDIPTVLDAASLHLLISVVNVATSLSSEELFTFSSDGHVQIWSVETLTLLRSFSIGICADVFLLGSNSLGTALDKTMKTMKIFSLVDGKVLCGDVVPNNAISVVMTSDLKSLIVLSEQPHLTLHKITLQGLLGLLVKIIPVKLGFAYVSINMILTQSERYMGLQVRIPDKDYKVIEASWKKGGNLPQQRHPNRYAAIDLSSATGKAIHCYHPLTTVPTLGVRFEPYKGNTLLIATRRWLAFWDIPTGKCDQRLGRSLRKTMFYRPHWVEAAAGPNISITRSPDNNYLAVGSEDGYMFVYEVESGLPVTMKAPVTKHQAPVTHTCFTPNSALVLSACQNGVLRMWVTQTAVQVAMLQLGCPIQRLMVTYDGNHVVLVIGAERLRVGLFKLHLGKN